MHYYFIKKLKNLQIMYSIEYYIKSHLNKITTPEVHPLAM